MEKCVLLCVLIACLVASSPEPVQAASELETWCQEQSAGWHADTNTCIVLPAKDTAVTGTLALLSGETLSNYGYIGNDGDIHSDGTVHNEGIIDNHGYLRNDDYIGNYGAIRNYGTIENDGTIGNHGVISNYRVISNPGVIDNYGAIYTLCMGAFSGMSPSNWGDGVIYNLDQCSFLPVVARD